MLHHVIPLGPARPLIHLDYYLFHFRSGALHPSRPRLDTCCLQPVESTRPGPGQSEALDLLVFHLLQKRQRQLPDGATCIDGAAEGDRVVSNLSTTQRTKNDADVKAPPVTTSFFAQPDFSVLVRGIAFANNNRQ